MEKREGRPKLGVTYLVNCTLQPGHNFWILSFCVACLPECVTMQRYVKGKTMMDQIRSLDEFVTSWHLLQGQLSPNSSRFWLKAFNSVFFCQERQGVTCDSIQPLKKIRPVVQLIWRDRATIWLSPVLRVSHILSYANYILVPPERFRWLNWSPTLS